MSEVDIEEHIKRVEDLSLTIQGADGVSLRKVVTYLHRLRGYVCAQTVCPACEFNEGHDPDCRLARHRSSSVYVELQLAREVYDGEDQ